MHNAELRNNCRKFLSLQSVRKTTGSRTQQALDLQCNSHWGNLLLFLKKGPEGLKLLKIMWYLGLVYWQRKLYSHLDWVSNPWQFTTHPIILKMYHFMFHFLSGLVTLGVSSVTFPFRFPFQLHCGLVSSRVSSQSVQNILKWRVTYNERPIWSYLFWGSAKWHLNW